MMLSEQNEIFVLEVNTIPPGMTFEQLIAEGGKGDGDEHGRSLHAYG